MGKFQMKGRADIRMKDKEITELAKANSRWDHKKIILLSFAVALSVFVLFSAFISESAFQNPVKKHV